MMHQVQLTEEEVSQTLQRAEEIAAAGTSVPGLEQTYSTYIKAAEELGIPRDALILALRERLDIQMDSVEVGARVFAPSADGFCYAATVSSADNQMATVQFVTGGTATVSISGLKPFSLSPGTIVNGCHKGDDDWWSARVRFYDEGKNEVTIVYRTDGSIEVLPLERIRLPIRARPAARSAWQWLPSPILDLAVKLTAGGVIGFLLAQLLH